MTAASTRSDGDDAKVWIQGEEIASVGGDDRLAGAPGADDHVGVDHVGCAAGGEQWPTIAVS